MEKLAAYEWPGNVRELENVIEHAMALADGDWIGSEDIPNQLLIALFADNSHTDAIGPVSLAKKNFEASVQASTSKRYALETAMCPGPPSFLE